MSKRESILNTLPELPNVKIEGSFDGHSLLIKEGELRQSAGPEIAEGLVESLQVRIEASKDDLNTNSTNASSSNAAHEEEDDDAFEESLFDKEKRRLEEEGRKAALGMSLKPTDSLESKYEKAKKQYTEILHNIGIQMNAKMESKLFKFKKGWASLQIDVKDILNYITIPENSCKLSKSEWTELRQDARKTSDERENELRKLELDLDSIEKERAQLLNSQLMDYGKQVRKIKFLPKDVVTRLLQDEVASTNDLLIQNREKIIKYVATFRTVNVEMDKRLESCFDGYGQLWHQIRFDYIFSNYENQIKSIMGQDIHQVYNYHQEIINSNTQDQIKCIELLTKTPISKVNEVFLQDWKLQMLNTIQKQDEAIQKLKFNIQEFEDRLEKEAHSCLSKWRANLAECDVEVNKRNGLHQLMVSKIDEHRQVQEYLAGKRACMVLPLQSHRNQDIFNQLLEFFNVILALKNDNKSEIESIEKDTGRVLQTMKEQHQGNITWAEKILVKDITYLNEERFPQNIHLRMDKLIESLLQMDASKTQFHEQNIQMSKEMFQKVIISLDAHINRLCGFFKLKVVSTNDTVEGEQEVSKQETHTTVLIPTEEIVQVSIHNQVYECVKVKDEIQFIRAKVKEYQEYKAAKLKAEQELLLKSTKKVKKKEDLVVSYKAKPVPAKDSKKEEKKEVVLEKKQELDPELETAFASSVVEIPQIPHQVLQCIREYTQTSLLEEAFAIKSQLVHENEQQIQKLVSQMGIQRTKDIRILEKKQLEIKEICRNRLETLRNLENVFDNQAQIIAFKISSLRSHYSEAMTQLDTYTQDYLNNIIPEFSNNLETSKSSEQVSSLIKKFKKKTHHQKEKMQKLLSESNKEFDDGMKGLVKSQEQYQHLSAWEVLCTRGYHVQSDIIELDQFKELFNEKIQTIQTDISDAANKLSHELSMQKEDLEFSEKIQRLTSTIKMKIRAQLSSCSSTRNNLNAFVDELASMTRSKTFTWDEMKSMFDLIESIRIGIIEQSVFLNCLKDGKMKDNFVNRYHLGFEEYLKSREILYASEQERIQSTQREPSVDKISFNPTHNSQDKSDKSVDRNKSEKSETHSDIARHASTKADNEQKQEENDKIKFNPNEESLSKFIHTLKEEAKSRIFIHSKEYFDKRKIHRVKELAETFDEYLIKMDGALEDISLFADKARDKELIELRQLILRNEAELKNAMEQTFSCIYSNALAESKSKWLEIVSRFIQLRSMLLQDKDELKRQLKHRLGHPQNAQELRELESTALKTVQELTEYMNEMQEQVKSELLRVSKDFFYQIEFVTLALTGVLDGTIMIQHVDVPPIRKTKQAKTAAQYLRELQKEQLLKAQIEAEKRQSLLESNAFIVRKGLCLETLSFGVSMDWVLDVLCKDTDSHVNLYTQRDATFESFVEEMNRRVQLLRVHLDNEKRYEGEWMDHWNHQVLRIKQVYN